MESFSFLSSHDLNGEAHGPWELMLLNDHYRALVEIIDSENTDHITGKSLTQRQKIFKDRNSRSSRLTLWRPTAFPAAFTSKFHVLYKPILQLSSLLK